MLCNVQPTAQHRICLLFYDLRILNILNELVLLFYISFLQKKNNKIFRTENENSNFTFELFIHKLSLEQIYEFMILNILYKIL
jgi:hypothetical protein